MEPKISTTDERDIEELNEMYRPFCWQGYDKDPGGVMQLTWYGIMKEFNCKATSNMVQVRKGKRTAFTHRHLSPEEEEETPHHICQDTG